MKGLIIEGVAGTGKSSLLSLLKKDAKFLIQHPGFKIIDEETTTGELVVELRNPSLSDEDRYSRLIHLLPQIRKELEDGKFLILERFHPTYYALMPNCSLADNFDEELFKLDFGCVLLDLPDEDLEMRSFSRPEMEEQNWMQNLTSWYGSKEAAVEAFTDSQRKRREYFQKSKLQSITISTKGKDWRSYLEEVREFCKS